MILIQENRNVSNSNSDFAGMFVRRFYLKILTEILLVLTDRMHKSGLLFLKKIPPSINTTLIMN